MCVCVCVKGTNAGIMWDTLMEHKNDKSLNKRVWLMCVWRISYVYFYFYYVCVLIIHAKRFC